MTSSFEDNIQLNLSVGENVEYRREKERTSRKRGERIKARRKEKFKKQLLSKDEDNASVKETSDNTEIDGDNDQRWEKKIKRQQNDVNSGKDPVNHTNVISSLFRRNPEIPKVQSSTVHGITEKVFSSKSFEALNLHPYMLSNLNEKLKLTQMTTVQQLAIPPILENKDVLVKSQTGSGKTLVFAIPIVQILQGLSPKIQRTDGPYAVIIVPTRELALQCFTTFQKLVGPFHWIVPGCFMGGEKRKAEKARLRKGINILIATPGRLADHMEHTNSLILDKVRWLIIDEADRLLDLGYEKDVAKIINTLNSKTVQDRQTVLLSATLTEGVERLAGMSLNEPVKIDVSQSTESEWTKGSNSANSSELEKDRFAVPEKLKQHFIITPCKLRLVTLAAFLLWKCKLCSQPSKMVVFLSTQDSVEFHYSLFQHFFGEQKSELSYSKEETSYIDIYKLHGDMPQKERTSIYYNFCDASTGVLLCTDVAARGLHLPKVKWIVQYMTPGGVTEYVHRVGRTARAGLQGNSLLFLMPSEVEYIKLLNNQKISLEELQMDKVLKILTPVVCDLATITDTEREQPRTHEEAATYLQMSFETYVHKNKEMLELARKAFQSFVRAYATYPSNLKSIFHIKYLHLGHLAKSFGLRDAPGTITTDWKHSHILKRKKSSVRSSGEEVKKSKLSKEVSEFSSGLKKGKLAKFAQKKKKKGKR